VSRGGWRRKRKRRRRRRCGRMWGGDGITKTTKRQQKALVPERPAGTQEETHSVTQTSERNVVLAGPGSF